MNQKKRILLALVAVVAVLDIALAFVARPVGAQMLPDNKVCGLNVNQINVCKPIQGTQCSSSGDCPQPNDN